MALIKKVRRIMSSAVRPDLYRAPGTRPAPECVVLGVRDGAVPSSKPPVRIFLGTEPAQYRAERVFFWSIEQVRDPGRVYQIFLMKDLAGFDRSQWLTGFSNYRFAIPHFAGSSGRAIYNDVDQVYLADPGALFEADLGEHGFLALSARDTAVMLIDCARLESIWTLSAAQSEQRKALEAKARTLWGPLNPMWHTRDREYQPGRSKLLHYTTIHAQPWQPFPQRYAYQRNPVAQVWFDLEHAADAAGYQIFQASQPSSQYTTLLGRLLAASNSQQPSQTTDTPGAALTSLAPFCGASAGLRDVITQSNARTLLVCELVPRPNRQVIWGQDTPGGTQQTLSLDAFTNLITSSEQPGPFDGVVCPEVFDYLPDEDVPWVLDQVFRSARRFVYITVVDCARTTRLPDTTLLPNRPRDQEWWETHMQTIGMRYPAVHWRLVVQHRNTVNPPACTESKGGRRLNGPPTVWVLTSHKPGHTIQSVGLAEALNVPYALKELHFSALTEVHKHVFGSHSATCIGVDTARSAPLAPPWPDIVIATGWRPARVARWIRQQNQDQTRVILLGRKAGGALDSTEIGITCRHFRLPPHPHRIETLSPLSHITTARLEQAAGQWRQLFATAPHPRIALLIGGSTARYRLDADTARRLGQQVRNLAQTAGGSVFVTTSRRTGAPATRALQEGLGEVAYLHRWQPGQQTNPYLAYLSLADVLIVTGESESMLAEAATTDKPVYIYPLPEQPPGLRARLKEWLVSTAQTGRMKKKGTVRPQQGLEYVCARLIERGVIQPRRDISALHHTLVQQGIAHFFGEPLETGPRPRLHEIDTVANQVRTLLGLEAS